MASSSSGSSWLSKQRATLKRQAKALPAWVVVSLGGMVFALGIVLLIIPGPGIPFVVLGVTLLATRVPWVGRVAHAARKKFSRLRRRLRRRFGPPPKHHGAAHE